MLVFVDPFLHLSLSLHNEGPDGLTLNRFVFNRKMKKSNGLMNLFF